MSQRKYSDWPVFDALKNNAEMRLTEEEMRKLNIVSGSVGMKEE